MSDFNWSLFDRIHPSTKSVTAALTAPVVGRTRPALKWAAAVTAVTAVAAAIALLLTFGPLGKKTPSVTEYPGASGEDRMVATIGEYPITAKEMTAYGLDLALSDSEEAPTCGKAALNFARSMIARQELKTVWDSPYGAPWLSSSHREKYAAEYDGNPDRRNFLEKMGISRNEYIDYASQAWADAHLFTQHNSEFCTSRELKVDSPESQQAYGQYMADKLAALPYQPVDEAFLEALEQRMAEIAASDIISPDSPKWVEAEVAYTMALDKLYDGSVEIAEIQREFADVVRLYPGTPAATESTAYEKFCLTLRVWNGEPGVNKEELDLNAALPAVCLVTEHVENDDGLWAREKDGALVSLASISKNDASPTFTVEGDKLMAYGYEVRFHSARSLSLIGEGEMAGEYVPYVDELLGPVAVDRITVVYADSLDPAGIWPYGNVIYRKDQLKKWLEEIEEWSTYAVDRQEGDHPSLRQQMESYSDAFFDSNLLLVAVVKGNGEPQVEQVTRRNDRFTVDLLPYEEGDQGYFLFIETDNFYNGVSEVEITPATYPTYESPDEGERRALIGEFVKALARQDGEALLHFVGNEEIAAKLAGLELSDYDLNNDLPATLHINVTGGAFGPIPLGESEWYIDGIDTYHWHATFCPVEEDPTLRWYDRQEEQIPEFRFCHQIISELGLFDTVADYSRLSPAWYGERGNFLANVYANLYKDQDPLVHGEDVAAADLTAFIQRAFGVKVADFTGSRDYNPGDEVVWLSHLSGLYSNCGLVDHKTKGDIHTLTLQYFADYTRLIPAVTLECSIRDLGGGEYRMLSSKVVERGDYPPLCEAF